MNTPVTINMTFASAAEAAIFLAQRTSAVEVSTVKTPAVGADEKEAAAPVEKPATTATAAAGSTASQTSAPADAQQAKPAADSTSNKAVAELGGKPDYNEIKSRVLALSKVYQKLALATLGRFKGVSGEPVNHGNKLQLEDYPAFIAAADEELAGASVPA